MLARGVEGDVGAALRVVEGVPVGEAVPDEEEGVDGCGKIGFGIAEILLGIGHCAVD